MKKIRLTGKHDDHSFTVDDDIFGEMIKMAWYGREHRHTTYAARGFLDKNKRYRSLRAHRFAAALYGILTHWDKEIDPREIDHIDHNGLNNQSHNLRAVTRSENHMNKRKLEGASSRFKGVYWYKSAKKWQSQIKRNQKEMYIGLFIDEVDAAKAYDTKARELGWPEFGLNFPHGSASHGKDKV